MTEFERFQLEIIAQDYRSQGFEVETEVQIDGISYVFDAVARRQSDRQQIFIELVNKSGVESLLSERSLAFREASAKFPHARVELRYIDNDASPYFLLRQRGQALDGVGIGVVASILKKKLPPENIQDVAGSMRHFLSLWAIHSLTIRGMANFKYGEQGSEGNILDAYNQLLADGTIVAPETIEEEISLDLFQIFEAISATLHGAVVDIIFLWNLKLHVRSIRNQVKKAGFASLSFDFE